MLTGCDGATLGDGPDGPAGPTVLTASAAYVEDHQGDPERLAGLRDALDRLREETSSGWTGRQDDVTGYLAELSGGRHFPAAGGDAREAARALLAGYGPDLFGVPADQVALGRPEPLAGSGSATVRATQRIGRVPVLDAGLVVTVGEAEADPRVTAVRGRVFPGLAVRTRPQLPARRAVAAAERLSGAEAVRDPELVVLPEGEGRLAWSVEVVGAAQGEGGTVLADGIYLVDAVDGDLLGVRPASAHARTALPYAGQASAPRTARVRPLTAAAALEGPVTGEPVQVSGTDPLGRDLTAQGLRTDRGVELVDTTTPTWDGASGEGGVYTHDLGGTEDLPGELYVEGGERIGDPEALAAHALSRVVFDYYARLGRRSWDGAGGRLVSSVNAGDETFCNAYFTQSASPPQMVYGNPCAPGGQPAEVSTVEIDTAGHEITHGVIGTSAGLVYLGQSGALNESFADYFGNVIGNAHKGSDTAELFEDGCVGFTEPTPLCKPNPEGGLSLRYLLNGNTMSDYLSVLNPGFRLELLGVSAQDNGGVHLNSSIWNNALWSIRSRLAQIDGTTGNESPLAQDFDKIVYAALTTQLGPSSGFLDARAAIEQVAVDAGADPTIGRVAREVFDANDLCQGCVDHGRVPGQPVSTSPRTQLAPVVSGDLVAWLDIAQGGGVFGSPATARVGGAADSLDEAPQTVQVGFAGEAVVTMEEGAGVVRYAPDGTRTVLEELPDGSLRVPMVAAGLAGSDAGAAWTGATGTTVSFVDPGGTVTTTDLPDLAGDTVTSVGTGGGAVALGTDGGRVLRWEPGGGFEEVGALPGAVLAVAAYGGRVLAVDDEGAAVLFADGAATQVSDRALPFGAALGDEYAVWSQAQGDLGGGVAETEGRTWPDTDLYLFSSTSGRTYNLLPQKGQQGFPSISGDRIAWQDAVFGGDDIVTATIPSGL